MQSVSDGSGPQVTSHSLYARIPKLGWAGHTWGCSVGQAVCWGSSLTGGHLFLPAGCTPNPVVASSSSATGVLLGLMGPSSSEQGAGMLSEELQPYFESLEAQECLWRP